MRVVCFIVLLIVAAPARADDSATARFRGTVRNPEGQAVAEAKVVIGQVSGARILTDRADLGRGVLTDPTGGFELSLRFTPGPKRVRCRILAEKKGYVNTVKPVEIEPKDSRVEHLDITLRPGLVLAGIIRFNFFSKRELQADPRLKDMSYPFTVTGKDFEETFSTEEGGAFEIYVPPGEYRIAAQFMSQSNELTGVEAGTTNLVLEPPPFAWSEPSVGRVFDEFWQAMDRHYSYFFLKPDVDWKALGDQYRPKALGAKSAEELADVLQQMLAPLRDIHVWIETPDGGRSTHRSSYQYNGNREIILRGLEATNRFGDFALVGRTRPDGFGYFLMLRQSRADSGNVKQAVAAIQALREAPGFVVDLRLANGGSEPLAEEIARLFCAKATVYAKSKYRSGPGHNDFTPEHERILKASENPYTKPVVCLIGPGAVSSGEAFVKMMKCLPQGTTVGRPTRGASGNPMAFRWEGTGVAVMFSRWVDLLPDGQTFEGKGIPPDVLVDEPPSAYTDRDPTLDKALEILRQKVQASAAGR